MNTNQLISNEEALRLFFNDDVYLVQDSVTSISADEVARNEVDPVKPIVESSTTKVREETLPIPIVSVVAEPKPTYKAPLAFKHLGKNEKAILILVNDANYAVSTPQGVELLRKLLLSINLKNADFALVNYSAYADAKFEQLNTFFSCKMVLSFGISPTALDLPDQQLHQLNMLDDIKMIFTHNLHDLETDIPSKRTLWTTLKNL